MKSLIGRFFLFFLALVMLLAGTGYFLLQNEAFLTRQLQKQLADHLQWQLQLGGPLTIHWGRDSLIEANALLLENSTWPGKKQMLQVAHLRLVWQPLELLDGKLSISELSLADCQLRYEKNPDGASNWNVPGQDAKSEPKAEEDKFSWSLQKLAIDNCVMTVNRSEAKPEIKIQWDVAQLGVDEAGTLSAHIDGKVDQQDLKLDGTITPWAALWRGGKLQHEIHFQAGQVELHSQGKVDELHAGDGINLNLRFTGPEFERITDWLALPSISSGQFDATLDVQEDNSSGLFKLLIAADLGSLEIQGSGQLDKLIKPDSGSLNVHVQGPDLDALARTFGQSWLISDKFDLQLNATVENGTTQLKKFSLDTTDDELAIDGVLGRWPEFLLGSRLNLQLKIPDLQPWFRKSQSEDLYIKGADLTAKLSSRLNGEMSLSAEGRLAGAAGESRETRIQSSLSYVNRQVKVQKLDFSVAEDQLRLSGQLNLEDGFTDSDFESSLKLADLADTAQWLGIAGLPHQSVSLTGQLSRPGQGLKFDFQNDPSAKMKISLSGMVPDVQVPLAMNGRFDIDLPSLRMAEFLFQDQAFPDLPFTASGQINLDGKHKSLWHGVSLELGQSKAKIDAELDTQEQMQGSSASWTIQGEDLRELWPGLATDLEFGHFTLNGQWKRKADGDIFDKVLFHSNLGSMSASGKFSNSPGNQQFSLDLAAESPNASQFNPWVGSLFDDQEVSLKFTGEGTLKKFKAGGIRFRQGKTSAVADLEFDLTERPVISGTLTAETWDISAWDEQRLARKQQELLQEDQAKKDPGGRLISDQPIELFAEMNMDLSLGLSVDRLLLSQNEMHQLSLMLELKQDSFRFGNFTFKGIHGGVYKGNLSGHKAGDATEINLESSMHDLKLGLIGGPGQDPLTLPASDAEISLTGSGRNWQGLVQSLSGRARFFTGSGKVSRKGPEYLFSDLLTQVFDTLNPLSQKSQYTDLSCSVIAADFQDGVLKLEPIVIQTDKITAFSEGEVDLATENVNLTFQTVARKGLGISAGSMVNPFFKIGGSLKNPALQLDVAKGAISSGAFIATAGLSVLFKSFSDRFLSSNDPCGEARKAIKMRDQGSSGSQQKG